MTSKTERFELRLNQDILDQLDKWREKQSDLPSRSEGVRRLLEVGLAMPMEQAFVAMKFQILTASLLPGACKAISDAHVFAWSQEVYPLFDPNQEEWAKPFAAQFEVSKKMIEELGKYLDGFWLKKKTITFYELEDYYGLLTRKTEWDRGKLINACRYMYLRKMFDEDFWKALLTPMEHPTEAQFVTSAFDRENDVQLG